MIRVRTFLLPVAPLVHLPVRFRLLPGWGSRDKIKQIGGSPAIDRPLGSRFLFLRVLFGIDPGGFFREIADPPW